MTEAWELVEDMGGSILDEMSNYAVYYASRSLPTFPLPGTVPYLPWSPVTVTHLDFQS